ncbi:interferon gamma receptor 1 isoform X2 [Salminus brasiliensis]|uniref:interferon gamma receptor 1 isoform X2 n=1 Tax=Salminus brasiliensis TaxID=930266 RepID=UPI003B836EF1
MRARLRDFLPVLAAVLLRDLTAVHSFDVTVTCDTYGVVVDWRSSHLLRNSTSQEFHLQLTADTNSYHEPITTWETQYNISKYLQEPGYRSYTVKVKTTDGEYAVSPSFSFNSLLMTNVICNLTFPEIKLRPGDRQLIVTFRNPLHLYRHTVALRNLSEKDNKLCYFISSTLGNLSNTMEKTCPSLQCTLETCESAVPFPEEQEEYCITVIGFIRQTYIQKTDPLCYRGSLKPTVPITAYLIPLVVLLVMFLMSLAMVFLAKKLNKKIKELSLRGYPDTLKTDLPKCVLVYTPRRVSVELAPVSLNPDSESTIVLQTPQGSSCPLISKEDSPGEKSEQEEKAGQEASEDGDGVTSSRSLTLGYDSPHSPTEMRVEIMSGDTVNTYTK